MSFMETPAVYAQVLADCLSCGKCKERCSSLQLAGLSLPDVARGMTDALAASDDALGAYRAISQASGLAQAVRGCFFCKGCVEDCAAGVDVCELMYRSRSVFQQAGLIPRGAWSSVLVDQEWHIFTAYRAIYGIGYADLTRHLAGEGLEGAADCSVAFFPGCSLAAYGPELTRAVFSYIEGHAGKCTLIDECCGSPLKSAGFLKRAAALEQRIVDQVVGSGASVLVTVCPGCRNILSAALAARGADVEVVDFSRFALEHGGLEPHLPRQARIFRSCQDRDGSYLASTLDLLGAHGDVETICDGCCGAGGAVSAYSLDQQQAKVASALKGCAAGDTIITMCPTCTYTQAFFLQARPDLGIVPKNYLELLFAEGFDWGTVFSRLNGMWTGEYGAWLAQTLG